LHRQGKSLEKRLTPGLVGRLLFPVAEFLGRTRLATDLPLAGDVLVAVSIIAVIACFGNFAFTYEKVGASVRHRLIAHLLSGILMYVIGVSLIFTHFLLAFLMGPFFVVDLALALLYVASVLYDFWDLFRMHGP